MSSRDSKYINHTGALSQNMAELYESNEMSDVVFVVENQRISAHRTVLAARSHYFKGLLFGGLKESNEKEIPLKEISLQSFKILLNYVYSGCMDLSGLKEDAIIDILDLAHQYDFKDLQNSISNHLSRILTINNICEIFNASILYNVEELSEACKIFADKRAEDLLKHDSFINLSIDSLNEFLSRDSVFLPEIEIYKAVNKWCESNAQLFMAENDYNEAEVISNCVRLHLLSMEDLCTIKMSRSFISSDMMVEAVQDKTLKKNCDLRHRGQRLIGENIAHEKHESKVVVGTKPETLLNGKCVYNNENGFTFHNINASDANNPGIVVKLGKPSIINHIKLLLWDKDLRAYGYYIEVSIDNENWVQVVNYTTYDCRSWQRLYFENKVVQFIKIVGTQANNGVTGFWLVSLEAMYSENIPNLTDGILELDENVASFKFAASVIKGTSPTKHKLLDGDIESTEANYTWHKIGPDSIIVELAQPFIIDSIKMKLLELENRIFSYYIETSINNTDWEMVVDRQKDGYKSWQVVRFEPRPVVYIKIVGTRCSVNDCFTLLHFECPTKDEEVTPPFEINEPAE